MKKFKIGAVIRDANPHEITVSNQEKARSIMRDWSRNGIYLTTDDGAEMWLPVHRIDSISIVEQEAK